MAGEIVFRDSNALAKPTHGDAVNAGVGVQIDKLTFEGKALMWDTDIPTVFRPKTTRPAGQALTLAGKNSNRGPGTVALYNANTPQPVKVSEKTAQQSIASGVRQLDKPRRVQDRIVQRRIGWQATPTKIVITVAERELNKRSDGKLAPTSEWLIEKRETYPALGGAAQKRVGTVTADTHNTTQNNGQPTGSVWEDAGLDHTLSDSVFPEGEMALACLPASVRASIIGRVAKPTLFDGTILQWHEEDKPTGLEVNLIRGDEQHMLVVKGEKSVTSTEWKITQAFYQLGEAQIEA